MESKLQRKQLGFWEIIWPALMGCLNCCRFPSKSIILAVDDQVKLEPCIIYCVLIRNTDNHMYVCVRERERELCFVLGVRRGYDTGGEVGRRVGIYIYIHRGNEYYFSIERGQARISL